MSTALERRNSPLATPSDLGANAVRDVSGALTILLADVFSLYPQDQKLSLAYVGPALPRLSFNVR
jgi:starvation-inducible DNA-binding protein